MHYPVLDKKGKLANGTCIVEREKTLFDKVQVVEKKVLSNKAWIMDKRVALLNKT